MILRSTGVNIVEQMNHVAGNLSVAGDQAVTGNQIIGGAQTVTGISTFIASPLVPTTAVTEDSTKAASTAFVRDIIPAGVIVMWSGSIATIPTGWLLCDGTSSTPDLRNKFIIGAHSDDAGLAKTTIIGSPTKSGGIKDAFLISHNHTGTTDGGGAHQHSLQLRRSSADDGPASSAGVRTDSGGTVGTMDGNNIALPVGTHTHTFATNSTGSSSGTNANLPPYWALAYIMKS
jgi:hypothetical protein